MDQVAWLALFAERHLAAIAAEHESISQRIAARHETNSHASASVVVLVPGCEMDSHIEGAYPAAARRLLVASAASGWSSRVIRSVAAVPSKGVVEVVTVRFARHDERGFAAWWNGRFDCAQYLRRGQAIERLGWRTTTRTRGVLDVIEGIQLTRQAAA